MATASTIARSGLASLTMRTRLYGKQLRTPTARGFEDGVVQTSISQRNAMAYAAALTAATDARTLLIPADNWPLPFT
jgi:hypothetical protein